MVSLKVMSYIIGGSLGDVRLAVASTDALTSGRVLARQQGAGVHAAIRPGRTSQVAWGGCRRGSPRR